MKLDDLSAGECARRLRAGRLALQTGPFAFCLQSRERGLAAGLGLLYGGHRLADPEGICDFHISLQRPWGVRRYLAPQIVFALDGERPFLPLPANQAQAFLEWGLNWCIASQAHHYLIIHSAVLAHPDPTGGGAPGSVLGRRGLLLPGQSGAGKSTLAAALAFRGWQLFSDELCLIDSQSAKLAPLARPINLKNRSIAVIRAFAPEAVFAPVVEDTRKGSIALVRPPPASVAAAGQMAEPAWVVFPRFIPRSPTRLLTMPKGEAFMALARGAFNYALHGRRGFECLTRLVEGAACYHLRYSDLEEALEQLAQLPAGGAVA